MMKTTVVTGFHPEGYDVYGRNFLRTFDRYWPKEVDLVFYTEEDVPTPRGTQRSLWTIPGVREFIDSHQEPEYDGLAPVEGWTKKDHHNGWSWRYQCVKFCKQLFIPHHAEQYLPDGDIMAWFDADVVTFHEVPQEFIYDLLGDHHDIVTVGRDRGSTDIGFWAVRINPNTRSFMRDIADSYRNGYILTLREWHSGYLFDHWLARYKEEGRLKHKTLTGGSGHVWFQCALGKYTDHLKGAARKLMGESPERRGISIKQLHKANQPNPDPASKHGPQ